MRNSSRLKHTLWAACLLSIGFGGCAKEKKESADKPSGAEKVAAVDDGKAGASRVEPSKGTTGALLYLPENCAVAVHIDIAAVMANAAVKDTVLPAIKAAFDKEKSEEPDMAAFFTQTGLDPFSDFHEAAMCLTSIPMGGEDPTGMGVVTGTARPGLLDALVKTSKKDNFSTIDIGGNKALEADGVVMAQLGDGALLGGNNKSLVEKAIGAPGGNSADFAAISDAAMRVVIPEGTVKMGLAMPGSPFASFADKIKGASTFAGYLDTNTITMRIATTDEASATELAGVIKMLLTQVPKVPGDGIDAQMMAALAKAVVNGEGKTLVASVTFDKSTILKGLTDIASQMK